MTNRFNANPWLANHKPNPQASLRLFCFPYAGGAASIYHKWPGMFPATIEICPVQIPGRGERLREPPFTQFPPLTQTIAEGLREMLDKPFAFFGHSMGAIISFELTRLLRRQGGPLPVHLFVSGRSAPTIPDADPPTYDLPEPEFIEELQRLKGTPKEVLEHPELMELLIPLLRADFELIQNYLYTPEPPLDCPITAFGGLQDDEVSRENIEAWHEQTTRAFSLRMLQGDHFFLNHSLHPIIEVVCRELARIK